MPRDSEMLTLAELARRLRVPSAFLRDLIPDVPADGDRPARFSATLARRELERRGVLLRDGGLCLTRPGGRLGG